MSSPQFITAEAMDSYCRLFGIKNEEDVTLLIKLLSAMDNEWIVDWQKKEKTRQKQSSKPPSGRRH